MNAFVEASKVEERSWEILRPFIETRCHNGRYVRTAKGPLARDLQKQVGDVLFNSDDSTVYAIEIKAEQGYTGNVFLERWSNRSRFTPGWFETQNCDLLLYHFLSNDSLYGFNFQKLREWFYCCDHRAVPVAAKYPHYKQGRYTQLNDTWAYLVPIREIPKAVTVGVWHPELMSRNGDLFQRWPDEGSTAVHAFQ